MFNKDFYPTPENVITQMISGIDFKNKYVLEPSAGKGNIIDYLLNQGAKVSFCEINKDLANICQSKASFLKQDFLDVKGHEISHINFIVMNPPFSKDEQHIMHAFDIAPEGCEIIALCNYETLKNTYSYGRKQLKSTVKKYGTSINLGQCFSDSERETNVEIGLIHLYKPVVSENFEFDGYFDLDEEYQQQENGIMQYNEILNIVNRYVGAVKMFNEVIDRSREINALINPINYNNSIIFGAFETRDRDKYEINREEFAKSLQKSAWNTIFNKMNMQKYVTKQVMSDINKFIENQINVPFTTKNIYKMIDMIVGTNSERMNKILVEAFDLICSRSHENSEAGKGWKTNSSYKINKNFIMPNYCKFEYGKMDLNYYNYESIDDMMKAFCFISGTNYDSITPIWEFVNTQKLESGTWYNFNDIFMIKGFKKGTMHFKFIDDDLWYNFNKSVSKIKGWALPTKTDNKKTGKERSKASGITLF